MRPSPFTLGIASRDDMPGSVLETADPAYTGDAAQSAHDARQMHPVADLDFQIDVSELVVLVLGGNLLDVDAHTVDPGGDNGNRTAPVLDLDTKMGDEFPGYAVVPAQCDQPLGLGAEIGRAHV